VMDDTDKSHGVAATPAPGIPAPRSSGLEMNAVAGPASRAAARSASCAYEPRPLTPGQQLPAPAG